MTTVFLLIAVFAACLVEAVEALTIVLAMGVTRGWRSTMLGAGTGIAVLAVVIAVLGPALTLIPLNALRLIVGALLLVFGLQWLRKAILRAAGLKATHDEAAIFLREVTRAGPSESDLARWDGYALTITFKGVLLEGLEVVFIVLTFGTNQGNIIMATIAATAAVIVVAALGFTVKVPLARVPENTLKYVVGLLLTTFGTFWSAEGSGATWPGGDLAILPLLAVLTMVSIAITYWLRNATPPAAGGPESTTERVPS